MNTYDPRKARFELCKSIVLQLAEVQRKIGEARTEELNKASSVEVRVDDLDNLWKMSSDFSQEAIKLMIMVQILRAMRTDNFQPQ